MIPQGKQTKSLDVPLDKGPYIVEENGANR